jgi:hypothetical protein
MKAIGTLHPTEGVPQEPDTVTTFLMTGGSSAQAQDWLSTGGTAVANAAAAGVSIVRLTGMTTAGAAYLFSANLKSTSAAVPASGTSIASSGVNHPIGASPMMFQVPGDSTGFSFAAFTSGYVIMEQWRK